MRIRLGAAAILCAVAFAVLCGCATRSVFPPMRKSPMTADGGIAGAGRPDMNAMMARNKLMQEMMSNPDIPPWQEQREKMGLAVGDRVIDKTFERTFDSMIIALANLGCRVNNMERVSGYITATLPQLPTTQQQALRTEALAQYAQFKGYPASVTDSHGPYDVDYSGMMERMGGAGLTLTMSKLSADQTRVKVRFDHVYYPRTVEELYKLVWDAVDKQIFLDKSIG